MCYFKADEFKPHEDDGSGNDDDDDGSSGVDENDVTSDSASEPNSPVKVGIKSPQQNHSSSMMRNLSMSFPKSFMKEHLLQMTLTWCPFMSTKIPPLQLIQEEQLSDNCERMYAKYW